MKKFREISEQHREEGRFKPVEPKMVKSTAIVSPRATSDSADVKLKEDYDTMEKTEMAQTQLHFIKYAAKEILDYISMGGEIEEWYQNKLSKVQSEVESLHSYIEGEKRRTGMVREEQIDEISSDLVKKARDVAFAKGKEDQAHRFVRKAYQKGQKESDAMAKKINEVSNELLQRYKKKAGEQIDNPATPSATKLKRGMGHLQATSKQMTSGKPMPKEEVELDEVSSDMASRYLNKVYKTKGFTGHSEKRKQGLERATNKVANAARMADYDKSRKMGYSTEEVEHLEEKNVPTSPEKWAQAKAQAKAKFDVYPSAYANGWAAKKYKEMGGGWKSVSEETKPPFEGGHTPTKKAVPGKYGAGYSTARHLARMALKKQAEKIKKPVKEETSTKAKIVKAASKKQDSDDKFQAEPVISSTLTKNV